jgi:isopentenyl phosphate kinase
MSDEAGTYVGVLSPDFIFIGVAKRSDFDKIGLAMTDHGIGERGGHCLSKALESDGVRVIFQHWIVSPMPHPATAVSP